MKRNYLLILFIIFGLIIKTTICFGSPDVNNWDIEHTYIDHITDLPDQTIGDTSGEIYLKVTEIVYLDPNNPSHAVFSREIEKWCSKCNCGCCKCNSDCKCNNCCNDNDKITSFHVRNNGFLAVDWTSPSGWTFNQNNEWYVWEKDSCGGNSSGSCDDGCCLDNMKVELKNYAGWTIGEVGIDKCDGTWINGDGYLGLLLV